MAEYQKTRRGLKLTMVAALICVNASPISAATAPPPRLPVGQSHATNPAQALRAFAQAAQTETQPNPHYNPFAGLLGKPKTGITLNSEQRAVVDKVNAYLSDTRMLSGN